MNNQYALYSYPTKISYGPFESHVRGLFEWKLTGPLDLERAQNLMKNFRAGQDRIMSVVDCTTGAVIVVDSFVKVIYLRGPFLRVTLSI